MRVSRDCRAAINFDGTNLDVHLDILGIVLKVTSPWRLRIQETGEVP